MSSSGSPRRRLRRLLSLRATSSHNFVPSSLPCAFCLVPLISTTAQSSANLIHTFHCVWAPTHRLTHLQHIQHVTQHTHNISHTAYNIQRASVYCQRRWRQEGLLSLGNALWSLKTQHETVPCLSCRWESIWSPLLLLELLVKNRKRGHFKGLHLIEKTRLDRVQKPRQELQRGLKQQNISYSTGHNVEGSTFM